MIKDYEENKEVLKNYEEQLSRIMTDNVKLMDINKELIAQSDALTTKCVTHEGEIKKQKDKIDELEKGNEELKL